MATIGPRSKFQHGYLNSDADIIVAGGAAGSSKSYIGLMRHLRFVEDPRYRGYCIRKNSTAIMKEGGLFDEAVDLFRQYEPKIDIKLKDQKIVFPSRASITFTHYENDKAADTFQGLQLSNVFYDEATHAAERHIWWLISRLRSKSKNNKSIWLTCNPDPDSFLRAWVEPWIYPEGHPKAGLAVPELNGTAKYILRIGGELKWADTYDELFSQYKKKHLPDDHKEQVKPKKIEVHLGTIYDNPTLIRTNPDYLSNLEALPEVERQRLLLGNWNVREQGASHFQREWVEEITHIDPEDIVASVRTHDFAMTMKSDVNPSPDYTVSTLMHKLRNGEYVIASVTRHRVRTGDWLDFVLGCSEGDSSRTEYYLPLDPGPMAKRSVELLVRDFAEAGLPAKTISTNKSKLDRFRPFSAFAQSGGIKILKNCCTDLENKIYNDNNFFYKELESFTGERKKGESGHDDMVDTISDAFYVLAAKKRLGNFSQAFSSLSSSLTSKPGVV